MATYNPNNPSTTGTTGSTLTDRPMERVADTAAEKATGVTNAIGTRLERAGDFLEEKGKGAFVADKLHTAGRYLQENDARTMARNVDSAICAHPYRGILIGLGVGWVVGKFLSRD